MTKNVVFLCVIILATVSVTLFERFASPVHDGINGLQRCGPGERITCVVDGDKLWLNGQNLRLRDFDTPEPFTNLCGGEYEKALARRATARLIELLNTHPWTWQSFGVDATGERLLATIRINGEDVGDILIGERLARSWPNGHEFWCHG